ncbi:DUF397 domain-containing protein [Actinokineospora sp.]|uniref:DUF397 domain-containing protein n=1 Tax=Actinokineospora sp. TaxID=1872133 RepID=UPI003D6BE34F
MRRPISSPAKRTAERRKSMNTVARTWRKSSRSSTQTNCVEVRGDLTALRDSKNPEPTLVVDIRQLLAVVKASHA